MFMEKKNFTFYIIDITCIVKKAWIYLAFVT